MKKFLKRFLIIGSIGLVVVLGLAAGAAAIFQRQIGNQIIKTLNANLQTELMVEDMKLSLFSNFPKATAHLNGVVLKDNRDGVLLEAKQISFMLGLFGVFSSNYALDAVKIKEGALSIFIDGQGKANYEIMNESDASDADNSKVKVSLNEALLNNIELIYSDETTEQTVNLLLDNARFSGAFSSTQFELQSTASMVSRFVDLGAVRFLPGKEISYDANIQVDLDEGVYQFKKVAAQLGKNTFKIDGSIEEMDNGPFYDLFLTTDEGSIQGVLQLLPAEYLAYLSDFSSTGDLKFEALVRGQKSKNLNPEVSASLTLNNGKISSPRLSSDLKDVSFNADFTNGKFRDQRSSKLIVEGFKGYFNRELAEMELRVENFLDPDIDFQLDGALPLNAIYGLFNSPSITAGSGEIEVKDLLLKGRYADMIEPKRIANVESSGVLEFDDASLTLNEEKLILDRGLLRLQNNNLSIEDLKLEGAGSELQLDGMAFNVLPVLFADSLNSQNAELEFSVNLIGDQLDIDRLLVASNLKLETTDTTNQDQVVIDSLKANTVQTREKLTSLLKGTFTTRIDQFNYDKIVGSNFTGLLSFDNNTMKIKGSANTMDGIMQVDGSMLFDDEPRLTSKLVCENIDIKKFFEQTNNFDQEVLTSKNVSGKLNSNMLINSYWDEKGNFLMDQLNVLADVRINEGELKDFEMLEAFSSFVKIKDLKRIKLVDLQNYLEIRKQTLYLPAMFIQSNALNLTISGEHTFENAFDYSLKVNAGQVLTNKFKKYDPSLRPVKARKKGFFNLHYSIFGTLEDYQFKSAKKEVKAEFDRSAYRKQQIELALNNAFQDGKQIKEPSEWLDEGEAGNE